MRYRFLKDVAIADMAFEAFGKKESELLENACLALFETMGDTQKIGKKQQKTIRMSAERLDLLLYQLLSEIVFLKDKSNMLFSICHVKFKKINKGVSAIVRLEGEAIDQVMPSAVRTEVKAVTFHLFKVEKRRQGWKATVVLDL